jgi:MarR family transcriptional regulator, organic hydroperoxide resistance regulator
MRVVSDLQKIPLGRLMGEVSKNHVGRIDQLMEDCELYQGQAKILMILSEKEYFTHSEIAQEMHISPAAASKVIKRLEQKKLLKRMPDPLDERISRVYLQEGGRAMIEQIRKVFKDIEQIMFAGFSDSEKEVLRAMLIRIYKNLKSNSSSTLEVLPPCGEK